jgi:hypothetical protein
MHLTILSRRGGDPSPLLIARRLHQAAIRARRAKRERDMRYIRELETAPQFNPLAPRTFSRKVLQ